MGLETHVYGLEMFESIENFKHMQDIANTRLKAVLHEMFQVRDQLQKSEAGLAFLSIASLAWPQMCQPLCSADSSSDDVPSVLAELVAHDKETIRKIDRDCVIPLMRAHAERVQPLFEQHLQRIIPEAKLFDGKVEGHGLSDIL